MIGVVLSDATPSVDAPRLDNSAESPLDSRTEPDDIIDARLGESFERGNLQITPQTIELVALTEYPTAGDPRPRDAKSYVLTFVADDAVSGGGITQEWIHQQQTESLAKLNQLNKFLKKLHKSRNIGPFIPSPKTMNDLCPCGSGLKYKDCCGKSWL